MQTVSARLVTSVVTYIVNICLWTVGMRIVLIDVCSIGIVNRYVCQLNFSLLRSGFYH